MTLARSRRIITASAMTLMVGLAGAAKAQQPALGSKAPAQKSKATTAAKTEAPPSAAAGGEQALRQRVDQLEEQLVDMQVVIGTLESLAKSGGGAAPVPMRSAASGGGLGPSDAARLDGMETQIRALTAQIEQLAAQVQAGSATSRRGDAGADGRTTPGAAPAPSRFGSTTVTSGQGDPIGSLLSGSAPPRRDAAAGGPADELRREPSSPGGYSSEALSSPTAVAGLPAESGDANPKQLYETAYGYLLQQDYGAAEAAFDDFLKRFSTDSLAGNAQYWLGESFYVRGNYKAAAGAFLKGYQTYAKSSKAPDSLLKLAMSLDRLGQKDAACSSFSELNTRFPTAPPHIKSRAQSERQRLGCG
jgi:tol-pal system protein YbgF